MFQSEIQTRLYDPPLGTVKRWAVNRTGSELAKGEVVAFDLTATASETNSLANFDASTDADETHPFAAVISVATAQLTGWVFAVAQETIADDEVGEFVIQGFTDVEVDNTVSAGDILVPQNANTALNTGADGSVSVGMALEDGPGSGTGNVKCLFQGNTFTPSGSAT